MKKIVQTLIIFLLFIVTVPLLIVLTSGNFNYYGKIELSEKISDRNIPKGISFKNKVEMPNTIKVWRTDSKKVETVDFEDYVARVVASEMPNTFEIEALKAQSVSARTFAMSKIEKYKQKKPASHTKAPICDSTHCQVFKTESELIACHPKGWETSGWEKIKKACKATRGELLYYDGEMVMQPLFFSSSGGRTENSEDVFVSAIPYLVSVESPYEEKATHKNEQKSFTLKELTQKIKKAYPNKKLGTDMLKKSDIKVISRTAGGRVNKIKIGNSTFKGTEIRNALGLSSTLFDISYKETDKSALGISKTKIIFTSSGSGHGVGMSQYGANGMAEKGYNYKEILSHYYSGTEIY